VPDEQALRQEMAAWGKERNDQRAMVGCPLTGDARIRLWPLYPSEKA